MPDLRLRELERQAAGGDERARARLLVERVRSGTLKAEHLRLAAHLGDEAAGRAQGRETPAVFGDLEALLRGLSLFYEPPWVRAAVAASREVLAVWEAEHPAERAVARRLLAAAETWLACPCEEHRGRLARIPSPARTPFLRDLARSISRERSQRARWSRRAIRDAARLLGEARVRQVVTAALVEWALA